MRDYSALASALRGEIAAAIRAELVKGTGILRTAKLLHVGSGTVQKVKHAMAA